MASLVDVTDTLSMKFIQLLALYAYVESHRRYDETVSFTLKKHSLQCFNFDDVYHPIFESFKSLQLSFVFLKSIFVSEQSVSREKMSPHKEKFCMVELHCLCCQYVLSKRIIHH